MKISAEDLAAKYSRVQQAAAELGREGQVDLCCCRPVEITKDPVPQTDDTLEGTPEQLIEALQKFKKIGVKHIALQFMVGRWPERREKIERFAKEVMPALRD